jgi:hypothetical protein
VFEVAPLESKITFEVAASVSIAGTFDRAYFRPSTATLTFGSTDVSMAVLDIGSSNRAPPDFFCTNR